jgi:hypothetical protein
MSEIFKPQKRTNFCLREPETECRLLWKGEGVQRNTNGGGGGGKQMRTMMKRIITQGQNGMVVMIMMMMIIILKNEVEISNRHWRCKNSVC